MLRVSYAYVKSGTHYLRPTPPCFQQGPLRMLCSLNADHTQRMGVFLPVLRTPFNVRLYAAFMRAYAAYRRPQNIELYSIWQKKHPKTCVCARFVVILHAKLELIIKSKIYGI